MLDKEKFGPLIRKAVAKQFLRVLDEGKDGIISISDDILDISIFWKDTAKCLGISEKEMLMAEPDWWDAYQKFEAEIILEFRQKLADVAKTLGGIV